MFKPPIQGSYGGSPLNAPTATSIHVEASPNWYRNNPAQDMKQAVDRIVFAHYSDLAQFTAASRQMRHLGGSTGQHTARNWGDLRADLAYNHGVETLNITVYPENSPRGGAQQLTGQAGDIFDVKWYFTSFPFPGMTQNGGRDVLPALQSRGIAYVYDPMFSPSGPGPTSRVDPSTGYLVCVDPVAAPDGTPSSYSAFNSPQYWTVNLGASAILTTPLSGLQYWEVLVVTLPRGNVPNGFVRPLPTVSHLGSDGVTVSGVEWNGDLATTLLTNADQNGMTYTWHPACDTFLTPAIGICPGYFLPDDLLPGQPTAKPKKFHDYGRLLGLDAASTNVYDQAASIYAVAVSTAVGTASVLTFHQGRWTYTNNTTHAVTDWMEDSFITDPPPGGQPWPNPKVSLVGRVYAVANSFGVYSAGAHNVIANTVDNGSGYAVQIMRWDNTEIIETVSSATAIVAAAGGVAAILAGTGGGLPSGSTTTVRTLGGIIGPYTQVTLDVPQSGPPPGMTGTAGTANPEILDSLTIWSDDHHITITGHETVTWSAPVGQFSWFGDTWNLLCVDGYDDGGVTYHHIAAHYDAPITNARIVGDLTQTEISPGAPTGTPLDQILSAGYHTPVYTGRAEPVHLTFNPHGGPPVLTASTFTGVDIGPLEVNDTVMIATDAAKGYVWFGRNGLWYLDDGATVAHDAASPTTGPAASPPTGWAAIMDGGSAGSNPITQPPGPWNRATARPQYFPCVSHRLGPGEVKIIYDKGKLKYAPPASFKVYGQVKTV